MNYLQFTTHPSHPLLCWMLKITPKCWKAKKLLLFILQTDGKMSLVLGTIALWHNAPMGNFRPGAFSPLVFPHLQTLVQHKSHDCRGVQRPQRQLPGQGPLTLVLGRRLLPGFRGPRANLGGVPCGGGQRWVNRAVAWDPWAVLASLQQPSLVPGCAWRSGLRWSPRTPGSADTSSSPSTPASETELTIAGRQTEGVRACVRALPSPSRFGSSGRSRLLSVWAGLRLIYIVLLAQLSQIS